MASSFESLKDLELTRDEVERLGTALKDKEFRKLFADYVDELHDPENRKLYEKEITELEHERGVDVTFLNPTAGYVIKTSVNGTKKGFINICSNGHIKKPTSRPACIEGSRGLQWSLPHSLTPPREDVDNKRVRCQVFDVVFHPDTLHLAQNNEAFKNMVNTTACDAIESNFDVKLDKKNIKFPKLLYKGMPHSAIIKKPSNEKLPEKTPEEQAILDHIYANIPKQESPTKKINNKNPTKFHDKSKYTTPKYVIKHRSHIELENFTYDKSAKMNSALPKELVIEIDLPLLKSAGDIELDVMEKSVQLISEKPAKYKLSLALPYQIHKDSGNAKFEKDLKKLVITLPVKTNNNKFELNLLEDSGLESDSPVSTPPSQKKLEEITKFPEITYTLPEFSCHISENIIAFTLHVKNISEDAIVKVFNSVETRVKFTSISSGYFPIHYSFFVKFPEHVTDDVEVEVWENNVIVQITLAPGDRAPVACLIGVNEFEAVEREIKQTSIVRRAQTVQKPAEDEEVELPTRTTATSGPIDIIGAHSESSGEEQNCCSYSPSRIKGILKSFSSSERSSVTRSISESSLDEDLMWSPSYVNSFNSMDSIIPEDVEISSSLKKTVRFSDTISKQLYRSNSSILGQRKKNQRKAQNKKRAQERRHSESELSEGEEKRGEAFATSKDLRAFADYWLVPRQQPCANQAIVRQRNDSSIFLYDEYDPDFVLNDLI